MSFTVTCNKCGETQEFTPEIVGDGEYARGEKIIIQASGFGDSTPIFEIECKKCGNYL